MLALVESIEDIINLGAIAEGYASGPSLMARTEIPWNHVRITTQQKIAEDNDGNEGSTR